MASVPSPSSSAPPPPTWDARPSGTAQVAYGGFWIRLVAYIIDAIILNIVTYAVALILGVSLVPADPQNYDPSLNLVYLIAFVIGWIYFALMDSSVRGATLVKMAMGLRVVTSDGQRLSFLNATGRYFAKIISAIILFIGFIMIGFTDKKRGLHDMIAGTLVIKVR